MFIRRIISTALIVATVAVFGSGLSHSAGAQSPSADVIVVLPFENLSTNHREYNWVGESFADSLAELISLVPDLVVVSGEERELAYQRLRLPLSTVPTRATAIKIAREAKATMVVVGTYTVTPAEGETPSTVQGTARVIKVNEGLWVGDTMADGLWAPRIYDFGGALTTLQKMQGQLAFQVLYQRDKALPFRQNEFIDRATRVPQQAFEAYIKGVQTADRATRENYLKNALKLYSDANSGQTYSDAAFALGQLYLERLDWKNAAEYFSRIPKFRENEYKTAENPGRVQRRKEPHFPEAAFYTAICYWKQGDLKRASEVIVPLATDVKLTGIYNNAGAILTLSARTEKNAAEKKKLLDQAIGLLARAAESAPDDPTVLYNYGCALFLAGNHKDAAEQFRMVLKEDQRDGNSYFLFSKSLENLGNAEAATAADDQARRYLPIYAKVQTEWQKSQTISEVPLRLRQTFNRFEYLNIVREEIERAPANVMQELLTKIRQFYQEGRDDEALIELRRLLTIEPMSAEAYLLIGRINQRRGEHEQAIANLKTAIFWDSKLVDAYVLLGRLFLERGDRGQAMSYARMAIQIDPNNQEAIALQRAVEIGSR